MRPSFEALKQKFSGPVTVAEIGVRDGENAEDFITNMNIDWCALVDPYLSYRDGDYFVTQNQQTLHYFNMFKRMLKYRNKVVLVHKSSEFASALFPRGCFDLVYIDGSHTVESVKQDLTRWFDRVKPYGMLAGHDIGMKEVREGLKWFCDSKNLEFSQSDCDWWIWKGEK